MPARRSYRLRHRRPGPSQPHLVQVQATLVAGSRNQRDRHFPTTACRSSLLCRRFPSIPGLSQNGRAAGRQAPGVVANRRRPNPGSDRADQPASPASPVQRPAVSGRRHRSCRTLGSRSVEPRDHSRRGAAHSQRHRPLRHAENRVLFEPGLHRRARASQSTPTEKEHTLSGTLGRHPHSASGRS